MQLTKIGENAVATSEDFESMSFGISQENIGLILETLRSKMYSNPIAAVCREVSSNCRDSHREAGKPEEPIEISIAAGDVFMGVDEEVNATINFIDRGVGISPDRIKNIYLLFGASTKRSDNNQTGGFGYGAKTPFAYSDTFAVITNYGGKKYTYFFSIGENRRGDAYLISEVDTTDPNGTTVSIPLKDEDRAKFEYELIRACYFWDVAPKFTGRFSENIKATFADRDNAILFKKSKFMMANESSPQAFRKFGFIIDGIYYDYNTTKELEAFKRLVESTAKNGKVFLRFNTGEVTISTNRESLFYDKKTIELILKNSKEYASTLKREYIKGIQRFKTYYEFANEVQEYSNRRYNNSVQTPENAKISDLYRCLNGFDKRFIERCTEKYFGFVRSPFASKSRHNAETVETEYIRSIDQYVTINAFGKFVAGEKREKRRTQNFSQIVDNLLEGIAAFYTHSNYLERDSIKKNLTIFDDKGAWKNHRWYHVITVPARLDKEFLTEPRRDWRTRVKTLKQKLDGLDPKDIQFEWNKKQILENISHEKKIFREALYKRKILKRIFSEIKELRGTAIPTYDSIPETKISRTARAMEQNAFRVVEQTLNIQRKALNDTRDIRVSKDSVSYTEIKLSQVPYGIIIPTKSNNVYQMQTEIKGIMHHTSYLEKLGLLYSEMFLNDRKASLNSIKIIYAKANDYKLMKSIDSNIQKVYKVEDLLKKASKEFDDIRVKHLMRSFHQLSILDKQNPSNYDALMKFCTANKNRVHPKVVSQINYEKRVKSIRTKYCGNYGQSAAELRIFNDDWIKESGTGFEQASQFTITGIHDFFVKNKEYNDLFNMFKKHFDETKKAVKTERKTLPEAFRKHYGKFLEDIISNYYRHDSYRENSRIQLRGIRKMITEIDKKYARYSKK